MQVKLVFVSFLVLSPFEPKSPKQMLHYRFSTTELASSINLSQFYLFTFCLHSTVVAKSSCVCS